MPGKLTLVATPIGNLSDLSPRAASALQDADVWYVEDTRVSGKLQAHLGIKRRMQVLNDHTRDDQVEKYAAELAAGQAAALVTDGGSPAISDPGARLTDRCYELDVEISAIPGPSAPIQALALSGFFAQRFAFLGFLARKPGPFKAELAAFADSPYTLVLFESPFRLEKCLQWAHEALGPRRYAICREMTKAFEQTFRARLGTIPGEKEVPRKGEFTIVIEGKRRASSESDDHLATSLS